MELPTQQIVYGSNPDYNYDLYLIHPDGSGLTRLTDNPGADCLPQWSPDGSLLAYSSERNRNYDIYLLDPETLSETRVTTDPYLDHDFAWSPDGSMLAISYGGHEWSDQIWTIRTDGSGLFRVSNPGAVSDQLSHSFPTWSPDGSLIACEGTYPPEEGDHYYDRIEIHLMRPDGSGFTPLLEASQYIYDTNPAWSPDAGRLAIASNRDGNNELYVVDIATHEWTRLTHNPADDHDPVWSPDGQTIAFFRSTTIDFEHAPELELVRIGADGQSELSLTDRFPNIRLATRQKPSWSANGAWLAFVCSDLTAADSHSRVCLVPSDGSRLVWVTDGRWDVDTPLFRPE
jgi:TolB protein